MDTCSDVVPVTQHHNILFASNRGPPESPWQVPAPVRLVVHIWDCHFVVLKFWFMNPAQLTSDKKSTTAS